MWRAIQINSQQPRQKNLLLGTVPGGDGISFPSQTQHFKTGFSDSKVQAFIFPHHRELAKAMCRAAYKCNASPAPARVVGEIGELSRRGGHGLRPLQTAEDGQTSWSTFRAKPFASTTRPKLAMFHSPSFGRQSSKFSYVVIVPPIGPDAAAVSAAGTIGGTGSTFWFSSFAILLLL